MIRKATLGDVDAIESIYNAILDQEEAGAVSTGWKRGVYPTRQTAVDAIQDAGDMYVIEADDGSGVVAAARINQEQVPEYADAHWGFDVPAGQIMSLHTLVVRPQASGRGYGKYFMAFYEQLAVKSGCTCLRMDTNAKNNRARALYKKLGFTEADIVPCVFNGIDGVSLVCLEKKLG